MSGLPVRTPQADIPIRAGSISSLAKIFSKTITAVLSSYCVSPAVAQKLEREPNKFIRIDFPSPPPEDINCRFGKTALTSGGFFERIAA